jgi:hypothetical protein
MSDYSIPICRCYRCGQEWRPKAPFETAPKYCPVCVTALARLVAIVESGGEVA